MHWLLLDGYKAGGFCQWIRTITDGQVNEQSRVEPSTQATTGAGKGRLGDRVVFGIEMENDFITICCGLRIQSGSGVEIRERILLILTTYSGWKTN